MKKKTGPSCLYYIKLVIKPANFYIVQISNKKNLFKNTLTLFKLCIDVAPRTFCGLRSASTFRTGFRFERKFCKVCVLFGACNGTRFRGVVADFDIDSKSVSPKNRIFCWRAGLKSGVGDWARWYVDWLKVVFDRFTVEGGFFGSATFLDNQIYYLP